MATQNRKKNEERGVLDNLRSKGLEGGSTGESAAGAGGLFSKLIGQVTGTANQSGAKSGYAYDPSTNDAYQRALAALQQAQQQTPTYKGTYDQQLKDMYDKIANREKFTYDLNGDALYQQYKDQYTQQGKMAMMDTMGQAAALTGGYGNSYAQGVGQQAYHGYLQKLNDIVPELYGMALDQYNAEGDRMVQQYGMLGDMADTEYSRYQDDLNRHWQNINFLKDSADTAYDRGFNNWYTEYQNRYQAERDKAADEQWQKEYEEAMRQYNQNFAFTQQQYEDAKGGSGSSGGYYSDGSSGGGGDGWNYDTHGYSEEDIKLLQKEAGIDVDGVWGPDTEAAWQAGWRRYGRYGHYSMGELVDDAAAGMSYSGMVEMLNDRGVDTSKATVQADIRTALSK